MRNENKNLIVAIALSMAILIGWQYFFAAPEAERHRLATQQQSTQVNPNAPNPPATPSQAGGPSAPVPGTVPSSPAIPSVETREAALARSPRVSVDTPSIRGSINLRGGRVDDVSLKTYHETVDPKSPNIVLFSPSGTQNPYYAEFGWVGAQPETLPNSNTVWTADKSTLTPASPVTLTWDNGQGLVFRRIDLGRRQVHVHRQGFRGEPRLRAGDASIRTASSHAMGHPTTLGYYVLHEGLIGVLGDQGLQEYTYAKLDKEAPVSGQSTLGKLWDNVTGGFVGITDKYWAAAVVA